MAFINENFLKLTAGYLFPEIARRVAAFAESNPSLAPRIIRCGIGDVTEPLPPAAIAAMHKSVDELAHRETFKGYGPATGYDSVREAIAQHDFRARGMAIADDEIFLSDGSKPDVSAFLEVLGAGNTVAVCDPVYPVYVDTNVMAGNTGAARPGGGYEGLVYLPGTPANGFVPALPDRRVDVVYLCFPNNPTGSVITHAQLRPWVEYALKHDTLILYDSAYEAYIRDPSLPRSIFEVAGADRCAVEFRSFSKNGGFTGVRAGYTVVPKKVEGATHAGKRVSIHALWSRRWSTCSNGVSWPVQCAVASLYTPQGQKEVKHLVDFYMENARILRQAVAAQGLGVWGGEQAPYVWVACPKGMESWDVFDLLLREAQLVVTPGAGFGAHGANFFRISAFNSRENVVEAGRRLAVLSQTASAV
ncbi:MAG: LL-diaminopimelate aminotransferase [Phycisphaerae bacterium]|nr:LL-diaminopimelate aminotransferase [Phycisphaerae bacterium]